MARQPEPPLGLARMLTYGVGQLGYSMMGLAVYVHLPKFYTDVALLSPPLVGLSVLLARLWDGLTDPLMGYASDRTRSRLGRRRPYLIASSVPAAVSFYLLWNPPLAASQAALFAYFVTTYMLLFLFWTVGAVPYHSWGAELSLDYHERTRLIAVRELFSVTGIIVGTLGPAVMLGVTGEPRAAFGWLAALFGGAAGLLILVPAARLRERPAFQQQTALPPWTGVRTTLRNRPFQILLATYFCTSVAAAVPTPLIPYISEYVLRTPELLPAYILVYLLTGISSLPLWVRLSRRIGKKDAWSASLAIAVVVSGAMFFIGPGRSTLFFLLLAAGGLALGGGLAFPASLQADVIDHDELHTGRRREGSYIGLWALVTKGSAALTLFVAMQILALSGYVPNVEQTPSVVLTMRLLYSVFPATCYLIALIVFRRYPITQEVHLAIRSGIEARTAGRSA